ncbi:MAG: M23 family metallopeptidase [Gemmatimonadales bacterium]
MDRRHVTIVVHQDGTPVSRTWRLPVWGVRAIFTSTAVIGALLLLGTALYLPVATQAARVPGLVRERDRLQAESKRIGELVAALDSAERRYDRIRSMMGADVVPDPIRRSGSLPIAPTITARVAGSTNRYESGGSVPSHWPLEEAGFVTRGQTSSVAGEDRGGEAHPGIDIALPIGTAVRAAGGGKVLEASEQAEYGRYVLVEHPDGFQTVYGHLSRIAVAPGSIVEAGQVVGLTGNTGNSSAPHLHFEIRQNGTSIDPRTLLKEPR